MKIENERYWNGNEGQELNNMTTFENEMKKIHEEEYVECENDYGESDCPEAL